MRMIPIHPWTQQLSWSHDGRCFAEFVIFLVGLEQSLVYAVVSSAAIPCLTHPPLGCAVLKQKAYDLAWL